MFPRGASRNKHRSRVQPIAGDASGLPTGNKRDSIHEKEGKNLREIFDAKCLVSSGYHDEKINIYSLGVLIYRLLNQEFPSFSIRTEGLKEKLKAGEMGPKDIAKEVRERENLFTEDAFVRRACQLHTDGEDFLPRLMLKALKKRTRAPNRCFLHELNMKLFGAKFREAVSTQADPLKRPSASGQTNVNVDTQLIAPGLEESTGVTEPPELEMWMTSFRGETDKQEKKLSRIRTSSRCDVNMSGRAKEFAKLASDVTHFAFCYPSPDLVSHLTPSSDEAVTIEEIEILKRLEKDGGFVFLKEGEDRKLKVSTIKAIEWAYSPELLLNSIRANSQKGRKTRQEVSKYDMQDFIDKIKDETELGLTWEQVDAHPQGREIQSEELASALKSKTVFTREELEKFRIKDLCKDSFINCRYAWFVPAERRRSTEETEFLDQFDFDEDGTIGLTEWRVGLHNIKEQEEEGGDMDQQRERKQSRPLEDMFRDHRLGFFNLGCYDSTSLNVNVVVYVTLPYTKTDFDQDKQDRYKAAVAVAGANVRAVDDGHTVGGGSGEPEGAGIRDRGNEGAIIAEILEIKEHTGAGSIDVETKIHAGSQAEMGEIMTSLDAVDDFKTRVDTQLTAQGLEQCSGLRTLSPWVELCSESDLRYLHGFTDVRWVHPSDGDPFKDVAGKFMFKTNEGEICCPLWAGYLDWAPRNFPLDLMDLVASMLQIEAAKRPHMKSVSERLDSMTMMYDLKEAIDEKKSTMEIMIKCILETLSRESFGRRGLLLGEEDKREMFEKFADSRQGGEERLTQAGLAKALAALHLKCDEGEVHKLMRRIDINNHGVIDFTGFCDLVKERWERKKSDLFDEAQEEANKVTPALTEIVKEMRSVQDSTSRERSEQTIRSVFENFADNMLVKDVKENLEKTSGVKVCKGDAFLTTLSVLRILSYDKVARPLRSVPRTKLLDSMKRFVASHGKMRLVRRNAERCLDRRNAERCIDLRKGSDATGQTQRLPPLTIPSSLVNAEPQRAGSIAQQADDDDQSMNTKERLGELMMVSLESEGLSFREACCVLAALHEEDLDFCLGEDEEGKKKGTLGKEVDDKQKKERKELKNLVLQTFMEKLLRRYLMETKEGREAALKEEQEEQQAQEAAVRAALEAEKANDEGFFRCPYPKCNYKTKCKETLKMHILVGRQQSEHDHKFPIPPRVARAPAQLQRPSTAPKATYGRNEESALGLKVAIGLPHGVLQMLLDRKLHAVQEEFVESGSLQDLQNFYYVCYGKGRSLEDIPDHAKDDIQKGSYHGGTLDAEQYDMDNWNKKLVDFVQHKHAMCAHLTDCHVLVSRLYTTSSYKRINGPLRKCIHPHPFKMAVYYLDEALRQLRVVEAKPRKHGGNPTFSEDQELFRGLSGVLIDEKALRYSGGIERAPMSLSDKKSVAENYATVRAPSCLFHFKTEGLQTPVSISFLSVYPFETERLCPPLTRIKILKQDDDTSGAWAEEKTQNIKHYHMKIQF